MEAIMAPVKTARTYDSSGRRAQAERTRETILDVANNLFLTHGYAGTTVPSIAEAAGVSAETVYKSIGAKSAIVRALWQRALGGRGPVPAPDRSDAMSARETDPHTVIQNWARLATEVAPLGSPITLLVHDAAASDPEMANLLAEIDRQRHTRMRHNAHRLADRGWLRKGVSVAQATDIMWTFTAPALYELLVIKRRWSIRRYGDFLARGMIAELL